MPVGPPPRAGTDAARFVQRPRCGTGFDPLAGRGLCDGRGHRFGEAALLRAAAQVPHDRFGILAAPLPLRDLRLAAERIGVAGARRQRPIERGPGLRQQAELGLEPARLHQARGILPIDRERLFVGVQCAFRSARGDAQPAQVPPEFAVRGRELRRLLAGEEGVVVLAHVGVADGEVFPGIRVGRVLAGPLRRVEHQHVPVARAHQFLHLGLAFGALGGERRRRRHGSGHWRLQTGAARR